MKIPYGNADFADIRRRGSFYVDKTPFLPVLESDELGYKNLIFLRPRRMGKSLLVSMMDHYYDLSRASEFDELFRGLWVHEHPTPEKNGYLVLNLNFSVVSADGAQETIKKSFTEVVKSSFRTLFMRHGARIPMLGRVEQRLDDYADPAALMTNLVGILAGTSDKLYVLIDEYDTFANALLSSGQTDLYSSVTDKAGFVRTFYRAIKAGTETGAIGRVFVTGASPILLDDLYTGFNIVKNISNRPRFNTLAGFTRADVARAVGELLAFQPELSAAPGIGDRAALLDLLEQFYDGYRFAGRAAERVFNSDLVLYFLSELADQGICPMQMLDPNARTDYRKLHGLWAASGPAAEERRKVLETVLSEGHVWSELVEQFGQKSSSTTSQFVSLMYYTGMLTLSPDPPEGNQHRFEPPNRVIRELGWEHYTRLIEDLEGVNLTDQPVGVALRAMARTGDIHPFIEVFREKVLKVLGLKDLRKYNEKALKMRFMGAILTSSIFHVLSEKEFAQGHTDLFLSPMPGLPNANYAWMLELKYLPATAEKGQIEAAFAQAEEQLRRYVSDQHLVPMLARGLRLRVGTLVFVDCKAVEYRPFSGD